MVWLWPVDGVPPGRWGYPGGTLCISGMTVIAFALRG